MSEAFWQAVILGILIAIPAAIGQAALWRQGKEIHVLVNSKYDDMKAQLERANNQIQALFRLNKQLTLKARSTKGQANGKSRRR